ncbi:MAG: deoxyribose-phosphate aldolase [Planctomycetota bacterium]
MKAEDLARYFDHTILKPDATTAQVREVIEESLRYQFAGVCVAATHAALAVHLTRGSSVEVVSVVGFPLGSETTAAKVAQTSELVSCGVHEVDMVINVGWLKGGESSRVGEEMAAVVDAAAGRVVKVIIETCLLDDAEKRLACSLIAGAGAQFVKTSTGFAKGGATVSDVRLLKEAARGRLGVKASAGIRTLAQALELIGAGADRLGCSSSVAIMTEFGRAAFHPDGT